MQKNVKRNLWFIASILFMLLIFAKSAETYQQQDLRPQLAVWFSSQSLMLWLPHIAFVYDGARYSWQTPYDMLEFFIRKLGHVTEYAILAFLWQQTLRHTRLSRGKIYLWTVLICLLYASSDEWHQTFVPGRTGHPIDVAVDSIGILLATIIYWIFQRVRPDCRKS
ncbi:VanZ family protein [Effusibacillus dendaii]|uniref:Membrane protein n=1 Tax=Effusibacillus dendaii TaxID=2743772 RepID=A0A7I8DGF4_9BACL|nr:VanZ family protein [Effusibacillus dendaii]BCJ88059.1 membrane protein [Effusibacillus dendaii]